ncbi:MAG: R3H domain-containing nucleic acid-binding protein [Terracidiphilus sp.]
MPIQDLQLAAQKIAGFLSTLNKLGGLRLKYRISAPEAAPGDEEKAPALCVELAGPDVLLVTQHNGELLLALETIAAQILRLDPREGDLVSFDAANFKALRAAELRLTAETIAEKVLRSGIPYAFAPTNSRERRLMHMAFRGIEGVETASNGEGPDRFLAVYPAGKTDLPRPAMAKAPIASSPSTRRAKPTCPSPRPSSRAPSAIADAARVIVDATPAIAAAPAVSATVVKRCLKGHGFQFTRFF